METAQTPAGQVDSLENMKRKWGKYFKYNYKNNKPQINVPR